MSLGRTLPSLLTEACDRYPNEQAVNQWTQTGWRSLSTSELHNAASQLGAGLSNLGLTPGDRVALLMHSDINFCIADLGSLMAGLVNVPIDLAQTLENIIFILKHSQAKALILTDLDLFYQVMPYFWETPDLETIIVAETASDWQKTRSQLLTGQTDDRESTFSEIPAAACLRLPVFLCQARPEQPCPPPPFPQCIQLFSLEELCVRSQESEVRSEEQLNSEIAATELATIIYIAGTTKQPRGVMLTHENISANILAAFSSFPGLKTGAEEVALSFLPLTHIFARAFLYGHLNYGHSVYFSTPSRVVKHLQEVQPTILITVPRLLEKVYSKIVERGQRLKGGKKLIFNWALKLAQQYKITQPPQGLYALQLMLADKLVFSQWRAVFGQNMKALISGGAALNADLTNIFSAAGIPVFQGYGLTETSSVLTCNRGEYNCAGTVGVSIAGVKIAIADDGEILVKAPYIMQGYYQDPIATGETLDEEGWLHTGDLGEFTEAGFLKITGYKKQLFKLSTGKYVTPQPLESQLKQSPLVKQAATVGVGKKFCAMLIFPNLEQLKRKARAKGIDLPIDSLLEHPQILALYQQLVTVANQQLPNWSTVKRFRLVNSTLTLENGLLTPSLEVNRQHIEEVFATEIAAIYEETKPQVTASQSSKLPVVFSVWRRKLWRFIQNLFRPDKEEIPTSVPLKQES